MKRRFRRGRGGGSSFRDDFNQLSLFPDAVSSPPLKNITEIYNDRTDSARRSDPGALAREQPANGQGTGEQKTPLPDSPAGPGPGGGPDLRAGIGSEDGLPDGLGTGAAGLDTAALETPAPPLPDIEPALPPSRDFRITAAHRIGQGGLKEKARDNITAIRTLKTVESENRDATDGEKALLSRYCGWGALSAVFHPYPGPDWDDIASALRGMLSDEEYQAAKASTPNAHFTSPLVIQAMWQAMERLGLDAGANILEPSMGAGHFFGLMPEALLPGAKRTGVELDGITARIAKALYPDATIFAKGFEDTAFPDHYFDAVIGNIPFGNYAVYDPAYRHSPVTAAIHDYFLAKSLDKLRPGGVMALITSRYTMDKQNDAIRRYLSARADLIGAIRLPNTAFKQNAGTEVTTDILFLQKRAPGAEPAGQAWLNLSSHQTPDGQTYINEYFVNHPDMMLGQMRLVRGQYGADEPALSGALTPELLEQAVLCLPASLISGRDVRSHPERAPPDQDMTGVTLATDDVKDGAYALHNGRVVIRQGPDLHIAKISAGTAARIRSMLSVRDAARMVFKTQLDDSGEEEITNARHHLNAVYDRFIRQYGPLSSRENVRAYAGDPDQALLLSLETYDPQTKRAAKTAIFERRTLERYRPVTHVDTAAEALTVSLNETGGISFPRMEQLTGRSARQLQKELGDLVYRNPEGGEWETADCYLSGNVRAKLKAAQAAQDLDPSFGRNVSALTAVLPADLQPGEIEARLGSSWIPINDVRDFVADLLEVSPYNIKTGHAEAIATWTLELDYSAKYCVNNSTTYGTTRFRASDLIEQALNGRSPTAYDKDEDGTQRVNQQETIAAREKQQQLKDRFRQWIWQDGERAARLARDYNDRFNNIRLRTYDGSHLWLPGLNREPLRDRDLAGHQKDAVWRILQSGSTLLAHVVGAGKTWTMATAAMELRRLGLAKKPMFVVPNHLVEQWGSEFLKLYPQARLFIAGKDHFKAGNRQQAMARIASGTYDAVIVSHRSFEFLPVSDALFNKFIQEQVDELENAILEAKAGEGGNRLVKELEKTKKRFTARLKQRAARESKDNAITFEELGVDQIFVDEADAFKNLFFATKMNRIAGLPNSDSNRAFDMFMKVNYIRQLGGGRGVVFATGTPISNTLAEMYTMQRYLAPDLLKERGVAHFDAWAANFAEAVTALELSPDGSGYRMHTRFAKFINLPELLSMFRSFADVQTADMLKLPAPSLAGGKPHIVAAPASNTLKSYIKTLCARAEHLRQGRVDPTEDNMLKITGDGRKAALDMRLIDETIDSHDDTKTTHAIDRIHAIWKRTGEARGTQLVFCDLSTPNADRFNVYHDVRDRLVAAGIPKDEIAFIHDAGSDADKKILFDAVNAGKKRILIGSTEKMGAGTNVQKRLSALHHLDAPWRPRDIEQREGRILRQGNTNKEVDIYRYVTEGSFDAYMWQTLETKARFISQVMNGQTSVRQAEDLNSNALTFAEIKAIASGNPAVIEKVKVDTEIRKLDQLRTVHMNQQHRIRMNIRSLPDRIAETGESIEQLSADINRREENTRDDFTMVVDGRTYIGKGAREAAAKALTHMIMARREDTTLHVCGVFRSFEILCRGRINTKFLMNNEERLPDLMIRGAGLYSAHLNPENPVGTMQSIEHTLRALENSLQDEMQKLARSEKMLSDYRRQLDKPFEHEAQLKELIVRQAELNAALDLDKGEQQAADNTNEAEFKEDDARPSGTTSHKAARRAQPHDDEPEEDAEDEPPMEPAAVWRRPAPMGPGF